MHDNSSKCIDYFRTFVFMVLLILFSSNILFAIISSYMFYNFYFVFMISNKLFILFKQTCSFAMHWNCNTVKSVPNESLSNN